jgi:hypothetical protein
MSTPRKKQGQGATKRRHAEHGSVHPEMQRRPKKEAVPGDESSKTAPTTQRDARGNHDRDGNQEQPRKVAGG